MKPLPQRLALCALVLLAGASAMAANLYEERAFRPLVADHRAHQPGDLLTVMVYENSTATSSTGASGQRRNDADLQADIDGRHKHGINLETGNDFTGKGQTQRTGKLLAQITVTVQSVRPNGDLAVSGQQMLEINDERQEIKLSGVVRPQDIQDNNTVLSSRLAEANIRYSGEGDLAAQQRPSWWNRFLTWFGW